MFSSLISLQECFDFIDVWRIMSFIEFLLVVMGDTMHNSRNVRMITHSEHGLASLSLLTNVARSTIGSSSIWGNEGPISGAVDEDGGAGSKEEDVVGVVDCIYVVAVQWRKRIRLDVYDGQSLASYVKSYGEWPLTWSVGMITWLLNERDGLHIYASCWCCDDEGQWWGIYMQSSGYCYKSFFML